ncbi:hypothetical protein BCR36DRAFT_580983 [Piromyces finnis]|uniref:VPS37 C-terminal domain-containing protein n=1 Tax=Piromyces finnis TaxID=1754191 RepID=A0A1Y1VI30_9FUNG|nr:hypothetical protein BCR36DRAFT_580983 [Piromyces finnis]|eukprot:ORX56670.1 hypothetical protein BCR36DRAFT_580983 [Piromyces finnis]
MDTRQIQIKSLLQNVTNVTEKYNNIYEVLWYDPKINRTLCLSITLPTQFPQASPVFRITPQIYHPWVDAGGMIVGHKKLGSGWNQHVSLANVTNEIIKELKTGNGNNNGISLAPPQQSYPGMGINSSLPRINNPYYYNKPPPQMPPQVPPPPRPYQNYQRLSLNRPNATNTIPNYSINRNDVDIKDLDNMSIEELKELSSNESKRKEYINSKEKIKKMYNAKEEMSTSNKNLAEKTLSYKDNYERLTSELKEQQEILKNEKAQFETLMIEQNKYISYFSPNKLYSSLQQATVKADGESEGIANDFLVGSISADEFLKKYRIARKLYHLRAEKIELFACNQDSLFIKK